MIGSLILCILDVDAFVYHDHPTRMRSAIEVSVLESSRRFIKHEKVHRSPGRALVTLLSLMFPLNRSTPKAAGER